MQSSGDAQKKETMLQSVSYPKRRPSDDSPTSPASHPKRECCRGKDAGVGVGAGVVEEKEVGERERQRQLELGRRT